MYTHGVCVRGEGMVREDEGSCWSWCREREGVPGPLGVGQGGREEKGAQSSENRRAVLGL